MATATLIYDTQRGLLCNEQGKALTLLPLKRTEDTSWRVVLWPALEGVYVEVSAKPEGDAAAAPVLSASGYTDASGGVVLKIQSSTLELDAVLKAGTAEELSVASLDLWAMAMPNGTGQSAPRWLSYSVRVAYYNDGFHPPESPNPESGYPTRGQMWVAVNNTGGVLVPATSTTLGGVIVQANSSLLLYSALINGGLKDGCLDIKLETNGGLKKGADGALAVDFTKMPVGTTGTRGGFRRGSGLTVTDNDVLNVDWASMPYAAPDQKGGVYLATDYTQTYGGAWAVSISYLQDALANLNFALQGTATGDIMVPWPFKLYATWVEMERDAATGRDAVFRVGYGGIYVGNGAGPNDAAFVRIRTGGHIYYDDDRPAASLAGYDLTSKDHVLWLIENTPGAGYVLPIAGNSETGSLGGIKVLPESAISVNQETGNADVKLLSSGGVAKDASGNLLVQWSVAPVADYANQGSVKVSSTGGLLIDSSGFLVINPTLRFPTGFMGLWGGDTPPYGWLEMDGSTLSRIIYAALFAAFPVTFWRNVTATTFDLPDARAEFLQFWDHGRGVDAGRVLGSTQAEMSRAVVAEWRLYGASFAGLYGQVSNGCATVTTRAEAGVGTTGVIPTSATTVSDTAYRIGLDSSKTIPTGPRNYPRNIALMLVLKY